MAGKPYDEFELGPDEAADVLQRRLLQTPTQQKAIPLQGKESQPMTPKPRMRRVLGVATAVALATTMAACSSSSTANSSSSPSSPAAASAAGPASWAAGPASSAAGS